MSEPFLSEIRMVGFNFAPRGWAKCDGQLLPISQNQALYSLLGTNYGGDGRTTFALPDLRGRVPLHFGPVHSLGRRGGEESHTLTAAGMPEHEHTLQGSTTQGDSNNPPGHVLAREVGATYEQNPSASTVIAMKAGTVANTGGNQGHENRMPSMVINFCIALQGLFPLAELKELRMSEPFVGEIRMFAGNFAPRGWAYCDGQLLAINQNDALFSLLGTMYGGDGRTTFGLPDLRGRVPVHHGSGPGLSNYRQGMKSGAEKVTLTTSQLPAHTHPLEGSTASGAEASPAGNVLASSTVLEHYAAEDATDAMAGSSITASGGSGSHDNLQPFLAVHFIIALFGIYPSRH